MSQKNKRHPKILIRSNQVKIGTYYVCTVVDGVISLSEKVNPFLEYRGVLKGKTDLTTEEFLKIRKREANLD